MKNFAIVVAVLATLVGNVGHAQTSKPKSGSGAQAGTYSTYDNFAWGIGLGGLAVLGTVVGVTVAGALGSQSTYSH